MGDGALDRRVGAVRRFNRCYTRQIGLVQDGYVDSSFSLTQVRVLYELAHRETTSASELSRELGLDAGYLSRVLGGFERIGLIKREASDIDARRSILRLTEQGREAFAPLDARSQEAIGAMLSGLSEPERARLVEAMGLIEGLLGRRGEPKAPYVLRPHRPGDMG